MKMEQIECSETSAYKIQIQKKTKFSEHGESLKARILDRTLMSFKYPSVLRPQNGICVNNLCQHDDLLCGRV